MTEPSHIDALIKRARTLIQRSDYKTAETELTSALEREPKHAETLYCLAVCQRKQGQHAHADATLSNLIEVHPKHSHAYQERGHNLLAMERPAQALEAFVHAVTLNPALHAAWRIIASNADHPSANEAKRQLAWLTSLPPELVSVNSFIYQNKLHKAESLCRQFLTKQPHHPEAMRLLAQLGLKFQILDDAEFLLQKCLELHPNHVHARLDYVEVLQRRQKFPQALEQAETLFKFDPNNPGFEISLANALQANGDYDAAIQRYRNALNKPTQNKASVYVALGNALKTIGQTEQAIRAYRDAYTEQADFGDAYWSLANLKVHQFSDPELAAMRAHVNNATTGELDRAQICFALGKAHEDRSEFDTSFTYYQQGNEIKAQENKFDLARLRTELSVQKQRFDAAFFKQRANFGCSKADPIFIVGLPRAGSTLLEQILASHSLVDGTMELANIIGYAHRFNGRSAAQQAPKYPSILEKMTAEQAEKLGETYLQETQHHRQGARFFIDKMPNNFRHIALIKLILPNAKIIDARREPMACCFSGFKQLFAEGQEFSYSLENIGQYYQEYVRIMTHWDTALPGQILRVQHEDVLDDLEGQVNRILDFCGLGFEQACVDFHTSKRAVRTPSSEQVRQPIFKTATQQWRNYAAYLAPLEKALTTAMDQS